MNSIRQLKEIVAQKDARISELEALVRFYEEQFKLAKHREFGSSSEKSVPADQLDLFDEVEVTADPAVPEPEYEKIEYTRRKRVGKRADDLSLLPTKVIEHTLPDEEQICPECGGALHVMGHDSRRELEIIPAQVKVVEHRSAVYACRDCATNNDHVPIIKAPLPEPVIKGSLASPSAVAHIMAQKYVMHAPLYRQEKDWERQGVSLSRQTMANWVIRCAEDWLKPLYDRLHALLREHEVLAADETTLQVLHEPGKAAKTKSYMWLYRTMGDVSKHIILYEYQPSRSHLHPKGFLGEFEGYLHADGYAGYHKLPHGITIVGCWTHLRRPWHDALKIIPEAERPTSLAQEGVNRIGYLFHLEKQWADLPPEERYQRRLQEAMPLAEEFFAWCSRLKVLPKSALGKAVHYACEQRKWLMNVYLDGRLALSNNAIENSVRPFAVSRRNWLFCNTVAGADASALVFSIIETAKANGLKPFEYLEFILEKMPNTTMGAIDSLLPWGDAVPNSCRMPILEIASHA
jgi:transposase